LPAVVILPERLVGERERFVPIGATVLVRPYRPSDLYAALWPSETASHHAAANGEGPRIVDAEPADE